MKGAALKLKRFTPLFCRSEGNWVRQIWKKSRPNCVCAKTGQLLGPYTGLSRQVFFMSVQINFLSGQVFSYGLGTGMNMHFVIDILQIAMNGCDA